MLPNFDLMYYHRSNCRLCNSTDIECVFRFGRSQPVDSFRPVGHALLGTSSFPFDLYKCKSCHHVQLLDVVSPDLLYSNYIYTSSSSPDLELHFSHYSDWLIANKYADSTSLILDVGANDALLLTKLKNHVSAVFGVDPAPVLSVNESIKIYPDFLNSKSLIPLQTFCGIKQFSLILANNVFSHQDDLSEMLCCIRNLLAPSGLFIFEVSYLLDTVNNKVYDYVYHEHLSYHSITALLPFLKSHNMYIIDILRVPTKGGSIRVVTSKDPQQENLNLISNYLSDETFLSSNKPFSQLQEFNLALKSDILSILKPLLKDQRPIFGYGASATSTVLAHMLGLNPFISALLDDNPARQESLAPNSFVPVLSASILADLKAPVIIILAWRFSSLIRDQISNYCKSAHTIIIPLPALLVEDISSNHFF